MKLFRFFFGSPRDPLAWEIVAAFVLMQFMDNGWFVLLLFVLACLTALVQQVAPIKEKGEEA